MRGRRSLAQRGLGQPAAIAVLVGETKGMALIAVHHRESLAQQKLSLARAAGGAQQIDQRHRNPQRLALGQRGGSSRPRSDTCATRSVAGHKRRSIYSPSIAGSADSTARAP